MINWTRAANAPGFGWQNQSLQIIAMRPPAVPKLPHIFACRFFICVEIGRLQETGRAEEQCLAVTNILTQQPQRQALCQKRERELVLLVTERSSHLLKKRFVASVCVDLVANPVRLLPQTELRRGFQHAAHAFFGQILEGRLAASWPR